MPQQIEVPGMGVVEFPDGMSDDQISAAIKANMKPEKSIGDYAKDTAVGFARGAKDVIDTGAQWLSSGFDKLAGTNEGGRVRTMNDAGKQQFQSEYGDSNAASVGRIAGNVAATWPVGGVLGAGVKAVAPGATGLANALTTGGMRAGATPGALNMGARVIGGATTGGASAALVNPDEAGTGAIVGGLLPPAVAGAHKAFRAVGSTLAPIGANKDLAKTAIQKYEIPLGLADISSNGTIKGLRSILNDVPLVGGVGAAQRENVQAGFNKAVGNTFGAPETKLTADVVDAAKKRMGAEFDRIWGQNVLQVDAPLISKTIALRQQAAKLPKNEGASLNAEINDLLSKMQPDANGGLFIPGDAANKFQSYLRRRADGSAGLKNELSDLRQEIIAAFNRGVSPQDAAALTKNRSQYKAFKTVEPLLNSAEAGVAGRMPGDVPAALLPQAVARQYSSAAGTPLADLSQIGSRFIVDRTPRTGGSMRAALQNVGIGTALVGAGTTNPLLAAATVPAAAGVNGLLGSPMLARGLLSGQPGGGIGGLLVGPALEELAYRSAPVLSTSR